MEINYEWYKGWCITSCPNKEEEHLKVGNIYCHKCFYFVDDDKEKKKVTCFYKKREVKNKS